MKNIIKEIDVICDNFIKLKEKSELINKIAQIWIKAIKKGNKIIFCGNGGSASDSQHLCAELVGRFQQERQAMPSVSLNTNTSIITAIANDYGYEHVFSRQLSAIGKKGDVLVGISTSGNSKNVIEAFKIAKDMNITTIALTGGSKNKMSKIADVSLNVPSDVTCHIQEMHIAIGHIICGIVEEYFYNKTNN